MDFGELPRACAAALGAMCSAFDAVPLPATLKRSDLRVAQRPEARHALDIAIQRTKDGRQANAVLCYGRFSCNGGLCAVAATIVGGNAEFVALQVTIHPIDVRRGAGVSLGEHVFVCRRDDDRLDLELCGEDKIRVLM